MWLPIRIEQLIEKIVSLLGAIEGSLKQQESTVGRAFENANEKWAQIPQIIASNVLGTRDDKNAAETQIRKENARQDRLVASQEKLVWWTRLAFIAAAAVGGLTFIQVWVYRLQLQEMVHQSNVQAEATHQARRDSANELHSAQQQLALATQSTQLDERAWVAVKNVQLRKPSTATEKPVILVALTNSGKTPALKGELVCTGAAFDKEEPTCETATDRIIMPIAPGREVTLYLSIDPHNQHVLESIEQGKIAYHFDFVLRYRDIYQQLHHTKYCGVYPDEKEFFAVCKSGNEMD